RAGTPRSGCPAGGHRRYRNRLRTTRSDTLPRPRPQSWPAFARRGTTSVENTAPRQRGASVVAANLTVFLHRLTRGLATESRGDLPDGELLVRSAGRGEATAFEAIHLPARIFSSRYQAK